VHRTLLTTLATLAILSAPHAARAQLRPLEPIDWTLVGAPEKVEAELGVGVLNGQRASLAGVEGRLVEAGNVRAQVRIGSVVIDAGGTLRRLFHDERVFADPAGDARPQPGRDRHDAGVYWIGTLVPITRARAVVPLLLRFGTRLPTSDNQKGLDRDATDFFATLATRLARGRASLAVEAGIGIDGTRDPQFEQSDLLLYSLVAEYRAGTLIPRISVLGQQAGRGAPIERGTENLSELRAGARLGRRRFVQVEWVKGFADFSPRSGVLVRVGMVR
jgi:hypothetical protein